MINVKCKQCGEVFDVPSSLAYERCPKCGYYMKVHKDVRAARPSRTKKVRLNLLQVSGIVDCGLATILLFYFLFFFDVGVQFGEGMAIANLELMNQRTIGIIIAVGMAIAGTILFAIGWGKNKDAPGG